MKSFSFEEHVKILVFLLIILVFGIYGITLMHNSSFFWDDGWMIVNNDYIRNLDIDNIFMMFSKSYYSQYSPLNTLLYALIYNLFGLNAFIFHLVCIFIHLGNSLLVFLLIFRLNSINKSWEINNEHQKIVCLYSCFFVALMFGISPMQIENTIILLFLFVIYFSIYKFY
jgi:hypothetical protein